MAVSDGGQPSSALSGALAGAVAGAQGPRKRKRKAKPARRSTGRSQDQLRAVSSRTTRATSTPRARRRPLRVTPAERRRIDAEASTRTVNVRGRDGRVRRLTVDTGLIDAPPPPKGRRMGLGEALRRAPGQVVDEVARAAPGIARALVGSDSDTATIKVNGRPVTAPVQRSGGGTLGLTDSGRAFVRDAVNLPTSAIQSLYEAAAAGVEAAQGDTKRGKRLIGGLDEGALGRLVLHGDPKGAFRVAKDHPLYTYLEVTGTGQVLGRGAGAAARSGVAGAGVKRAAGTKRAPLRVEGTRQRIERRYSPNVIVKGAQVAGERSARKRGFDPTVARGSQRKRILNSEVDEFAAQAEGIRRRGREEAARAAAKVAPVRRGVGATSRTGRAAAAVDRSRSRSAEAAGVGRGRAERHVVLAAVEGRLRGPKTFIADLKRERARLQSVYVAERATMTAGARKANREQVRALDRVLNDPKARMSAAEVFRAADEYNKHAGVIEKQLIAKGALDPEQAAAARVRTYGVARLGLKPNPDGKGLVDAHGRVVPTKVIQAQIRLRGDREPGFVGQRRADRGASSYFVNWYGGRKTVDSKRRTGEAARTGAYDASFNALEEHLVRGRGVVDAIDTFDKFAGRFGTRRRDGKPYTWEEAERAAGELGEATGMRWQPVRVVPARYDAQTQADILATQGTPAAPGHLQSLTLGRLDDSMRPPAGKERLARNVVLVPAQQIERFAAHQTTGSSTGAKAGQVATRAFRNTVLPFSTKWLFGNMAEAVLRSAFNGITPVDVVRGARVMRSLRGLDEAAWRAADTRIKGGLLYGSADRLNVRRGAEDFEPTILHGPALAVGQVARLPVVRQMLGGLRAYTRLAFSLNRGLERAFQEGVIGKAARRDAQELTGSWVKALRMQEDVAREVARGLLGTPKQVQFARYADEVLGKYSRFSPSTRRAIQTFAPFLPWFLNAARFVGWTLPVRHPAKTALLANVELTLQDDIEAHRKSVPPGDLESAIRLPDGGLLNVARYTPFGAFTKGVEGIPEPLLPQIDSAVQILNGRSFTGKELRTQDGEVPGDGKRLWLAFYTLVEAAAPGVQIARRLREGGASPYDDSDVFSPKTRPRRSTDPSAANRILNPLRPTYLSGGPAASSGPGLSPGLQRRAERLQREAGSGSSLQQALQRRADRIRARQQQR